MWLVEQLDILLGFALGLIGAYVIDWVRVIKKSKGFRRAACGELRQILAELNVYAMHPDAEIDAQKIKLKIGSEKAFNLKDAVHPLSETPNRLKNLKLEPSEISAYISFHSANLNKRKELDMRMPLKKIYCNLTEGNIDFVSLLSVKDACRILNIARRIEAINHNVQLTNWFYEKEFDGSLDMIGRDRIKINYYSQCQLISDYCYMTAREVASLLKDWQ